MQLQWVSSTFVVLLLSTSVSAQWIASLPKQVRSAILWSADHESGDLQQWHPQGVNYPGGGVLNTGGKDVTASATRQIAHSGEFAAEATIRNATRSLHGKRAVRFMRWTDRPWDEGGGYFPQACYFSTWMFVPHRYDAKKQSPWDPGDGGWWNVFQFKANDENNVSTSVWNLDLYRDEETGKLHFGLFYHLGDTKYHEQAQPQEVVVGKWFHVEAYHRASTTDGCITIWQDGVEVFRVSNVATAITDDNQNTIWGIGNYTDHIAGGKKEGMATLFFDDAIVSTSRISNQVKWNRPAPPRLKRTQSNRARNP